MNLMPLVSESLQLLWPARCAGCDQTVPEEALFCAPCSLALNPMCGVCPGCALPRHDDPRELVFAGKRCARCLRVALPFTTANACFEYGETIARAIVRMKHGKRRELARRLARLMVPSLADLPRGCTFAPRCGLASEQCRAAYPPLTQYRPGHWVACWHAERLLGGAA